VNDAELKADLRGYLGGAREALVWKLDGLGEYDIRRPMTPTGTNLLGLVKHSAGSHVRYLGEVFGRPLDIVLPWMADDAEPNADMWATPDESRQEIIELYRATWALADATIDELPLDARGTVPWWGDSEVTLHHVLVHLTAETQRHAGHADIVRELIDGSAGLLPAFDNLRTHDADEQRAAHDRIEAAARLAGDA
jgi:Protein of unknown function (DUF664)